MRIMRWQPPSTFSHLHDEFDRMIERVFGNDSALAGAEPDSRGFAPPVNVIDRGEAVDVRFEVPGIAPDDVKLTFEHGLLVVSGEKRAEARAEKDSVYRHECRYGAFRRVLELPGDLDLDKAEATFDQGVLRVRIPKAPSAKVRELKITKPGTKA